MKSAYAKRRHRQRLHGRGLGNDIFVVDSTADVDVENPNEGIDTVQSSLPSYTLGNDVENLTLARLGNYSCTGNSLDNVLTGTAYANTQYGLDGNDTLNGGVGADTMVGGRGDDVYFVDNAGDIITENSGEGTDTMQSSIAYTLAANVENLILNGDQRYWQLPQQRHHRQQPGQHAERRGRRRQAIG